MKKKTIGILLVLLGLLGFLIGPVSFTTQETTEIGPVEVETPERHSFPTGPAVSGALIAGGVVLLVLDRRG